MATFRETMARNDTDELSRLEAEHSEAKSDGNTQTAESGPTIPISDIPRKRGRPKGSKNAKGEVEQTPVLPPAIIKMIVSAPYTLIAKKRGDHWLLSEPELENMVQVHSNLANKYLPEWLKEHADLYAALSMHAMLLFVRIDIDIKIQKEKQEVIDKDNDLRARTGQHIGFDDEPSKGVSREERYGKVY